MLGIKKCSLMTRDYKNCLSVKCVLVRKFVWTQSQEKCRLIWSEKNRWRKSLVGRLRIRSRDNSVERVSKDERRTMSGLKVPAVYSRAGNGAKPKSKICRLTPSRSLIPSLVGNVPSSRKSAVETTESSSSNPVGKSSSSTSPRRISTERKSPRRHSEERQGQTHHNSPKRSPKRFPPSSLDDDSFRDEMGLGLRVSTTSTCVDEGPAMSFVEFETLYNLEKEMLMQSRCNQDLTTQQQLDDKCVTTWFTNSRKGVYTDLPNPLMCHQIGGGASASPVSSSQAPTEGFSFAPGWSLNADHFYQWQHRGKSTQEVVECFLPLEFC